VEINVETRIKLDRFCPRDYQARIIDQWENKGKKKILYVLPRRSGKDFLAWNMAIRQCIRKVCLVLYALPTYSQARKCIFDAICIDGTKFIDYIPKELIEKINQSEMKITFKNGSILRLIGADAYDTSLVGTNAQMIILSEAALMQLESVYSYARPILAANNGTIIILSTPRGKNAFWRLFETAKELDDWYVLKMDSYETKHISDEALEVERSQVSDEMFAQEWLCSFQKGVDGQIYGRELEKARLEERVGFFPHDPVLLTHIAIDIGVNDARPFYGSKLPTITMGSSRSSIRIRITTWELTTMLKRSKKNRTEWVSSSPRMT
jgi:phage terminase large subunit